MNYTDYLAKVITKNFGGKVIYKQKTDILTQGVIIHDGSIAGLLPKLINLKDQCFQAHKNYLVKQVKKYPQLAEIFTKKAFNSLTIDYDDKNNVHRLDSEGEAFHHTQGFIIFADSEEFDPSVIPGVSVGLACQEFFTENWSDEPVTIIYFQIDFSNNYETEIWLERNGVKSANIHTM